MISANKNKHLPNSGHMMAGMGPGFFVRRPITDDGHVACGLSDDAPNATPTVTYDNHSWTFSARATILNVCRYIRFGGHYHYSIVVVFCFNVLIFFFFFIEFTSLLLSLYRDFYFRFRLKLIIFLLLRYVT